MVFKTLEKLNRKIDDRENETRLRALLSKGTQRTPKNETLDYSQVNNLGEWSGYNGNEKLLAVLEKFPAHCFKFFDLKDDINSGLNSGPWCVERMSETDTGFEGPRVGLVHRVYYNEFETGKIVLRPCLTLPEALEGQEEKYSGVEVLVELENVLLIEHEHVASLVEITVSPFRKFDGNVLSDDWRFLFQRSMTAALHNAIAKEWPFVAFDFGFDGAVESPKI